MGEHRRVSFPCRCGHDHYTSWGHYRDVAGACMECDCEQFRKRRWWRRG